MSPAALVANESGNARPGLKRIALEGVALAGPVRKLQFTDANLARASTMGGLAAAEATKVCVSLHNVHAQGPSTFQSVPLSKIW